MNPAALPDRGTTAGISSAVVHFDGIEAPAEVMAGSGGGVLRISRTQAIGPGASSRVVVTLTSPPGITGTAAIPPAISQTNHP